MMNTQKQYDLVIYIGRFQPFHNGHKENLRVAYTLSDNVLSLIGSSDGPRTIRNPWNYDERKNVIYNHTDTDGNPLMFAGIKDYTYNDNKWIEEVGREVNKAIKKIKSTVEGTFKTLQNKDLKIAVIGHDKDHTSSYLNYFPQWEYVEMPAFPSEEESISSTQIRQLMFEGQLSFTDGVVPPGVITSQVRAFTKTAEFQDLKKEWDYIKAYKKAASVAPYEPIYSTVDAVVEQSGHILLIQRGGFPGKGLWALPGGFLDPTERIFDAAIRELIEETRLKVPEKVLRGSLVHKDVFDDPERSLRGRTLSYTHYFRLDDTAKLPRVKGSSDAAEARWFSLAEFEEMQGVMFEDHYHIAKNMLGRA
jgi:bifunctional NMN adenylyltransferase/nudix hydrolase